VCESMLFADFIVAHGDEVREINRRRADEKRQPDAAATTTAPAADTDAEVKP
jgi:hypothetical protein